MFWQGSVNACCVHDDVRDLLVMWYVEVHIGEEHVYPWKPPDPSSAYSGSDPWYPPWPGARSDPRRIRVAPHVVLLARNLREGGA